ncbi:hypothetical protein STEG23_021348, partial [Scotinomys teguina]
ALRFTSTKLDLALGPAYWRHANTQSTAKVTCQKSQFLHRSYDLGQVSMKVKGTAVEDGELQESSTQNMRYPASSILPTVLPC